MGELSISILTVSAALMIHYAVWKIRVPKRQTRAILLIFFGMLALAVALLSRVAGWFPGLGLGCPPHVASYLHLICFVTAVTLAYMITYSAIEVDSPSLIMALAIMRAGEAGLPESEFYDMMNDTLLVDPRIRDLLRDGLATQEGDCYRLTSKGKRMARLFIMHRRLLGAGMGG